MESHLDYRGALERVPQPDSEPEVFVLHLGGFDLEPISYSVLQTLSDFPPAVQRALRACYLERPVLWADLTGETPRRCSESLKDLYGMLRAVDDRLLVAGVPNEGFYSAIVEHWLDLTRQAVRQVRTMIESGTSDRLPAAIGTYRLEACACVEALVQFLPPDDALAQEVRSKLEQSECAHWTSISSSEVPDDSGFVTWGVP